MKKPDNYKPVVFSTIVGVLTLALIVFLVFTNIMINQRRAEMRDRVEALNSEIKALEEEKARLEAGIGEAQSEIFWEDKLREQGYQRPGEETIVVLPAEEEEELPEKEKGFFEKILERFGF